jgi:predicted lipoprotein with Yx(FWY)xxD motif
MSFSVAPVSPGTTPARRELLGVGAAVAAGSAGCTEGTGTTDDGTETDGGKTATVAVRSHPEYDDLLVDGDGRTLYMLQDDTDGAGESTCTGGCADTWPPLSTDDAEAGDGVDASLSTFEREGGDRQATAEGWPLYRYTGDEASGDANGQGVDGTWFVLAPGGTPKTDGGDDGDGGGDSDDDGYTY